MKKKNTMPTDLEGALEYYKKAEAQVRLYIRPFPDSTFNPSAAFPVKAVQFVHDLVALTMNIAFHKASCLPAFHSLRQRREIQKLRTTPADLVSPEIKNNLCDAVYDYAIKKELDLDTLPRKEKDDLIHFLALAEQWVAQDYKSAADNATLHATNAAKSIKPNIPQ